MNKVLMNLRSLSLVKCTWEILPMSSSTSSQRLYTSKSTVLKEEVDKFTEYANMWWDVNGPTHALHTLNELRVPFARDGLLNCRQVPIEARTGPHPLKGFKFVDVGCGAGIYSEALARIGADVTGIDANKDLIKVAQQHATLDHSLSNNLRYQNITAEEHLKEASCHYDALVCSEVIEHITNVDFFVMNCVRLVKPGGSLFFTTINKNWLAGFFMIFMLENVVKLIPKGTHQYHLLMPPEKLERMLNSQECRVAKIQGTIVLPNGRWMWAWSPAVTYAMHAIKKDA